MSDANVVNKEKKRYKCIQCQRTFKYQGCLKSHVKKFHSSEINSEEISIEVHDDLGEEDINDDDKKIQDDTNDDKHQHLYVKHFLSQISTGFQADQPDSNHISSSLFPYVGSLPFPCSAKLKAINSSSDIGFCGLRLFKK